MADVIEVFSKLSSFNQIVTDSPVFRVHYRVVTLLLLCFALVSTYEIYYGRPISCFTAHKDDYPDGVLDNVCWTSGILTYPSNDTSVPEMPVQVSYYKWVGFFLFYQCIIFYLPHYCWMFFENQRIEQLVGKLRGKVRKEEMEERHRIKNGQDDANQEDQSSNPTARFLERYFNPNRRQMFRMYAIEYLICEALNLVCVIATLLVTNAFLGGALHSVGYETLDLGLGRESSLRASLFPRTVRCTFIGIDESDLLDEKHALCVLSESTMNEFIFSFLWVMYMLLLCTDLLTLVYRVIFVFSAKARAFIMRRHCSCAKQRYIDSVTKHCDLSEFFIIFLLSSNLAPGHFLDVLKEMAKMKHKMANVNQKGEIVSLVCDSDNQLQMCNSSEIVSKNTYL